MLLLIPANLLSQSSPVPSYSTSAASARPIRLNPLSNVVRLTWIRTALSWFSCPVTRTQVHATGTPRLLPRGGDPQGTTGGREGAREATRFSTPVRFGPSKPPRDYRLGPLWRPKKGTDRCETPIRTPHSPMELVRHGNPPLRLRELEADPSRAP